MMAAAEKFQLDLEALACSAAHVTGQGEDLASAHVAADKRISAAQQLWRGAAHPQKRSGGGSSFRALQNGDDVDVASRDAQLPAHAATVARSWRIVRDRVGMTNRLHDLRHFYASGLIRAGCDVVTVQRALGHSSAAITLTTYSHLWPDANDRTRRGAGDLLEAALGATADPLRTESKI